MDPREQQFQSLNFCRRLYNIMKFLYRTAHKMMISNHRMPRRLADTGAVTNESSSQLVHPVAPPNEDEKGKTSSSNPEEKKEQQQQEEPRAPKKTVSINENVETIINTSDKKKGKKKKKKQDPLDDPKPLKSILKVSSDVNNIADSPPSLLSRANGA